MSEIITLDVGCGHRKRATIGCDCSRDTDADVLADAHYLPFQDGVFDKVVSYVVLEHSSNPLIFLKEQQRVLKERGIIELVTDNAQYYGWSVFRGYRHEDIHENHYMIFFPKNVVRLLKLAGFQQISFGYITASPSGLKSRVMATFAKILVKMKLWRNDCLFLRFRVEAHKTHL